VWNFATMKNQLNTISLLHYVYGALVCVGGLGMLAFIFVGHLLNSDLVQNSGDEPPPAVLGHMFVGMGWFFFLLIEVMGALIIASGRAISKRRNRTFSMVIAGFQCLSFPLGTALGVFSLIALSDAEVKAAYDLPELPR
jgi:hypothetical protein